jgi:UDP-N-acetylmuramoylalanine--D-glutamate ligase
VRAAKARGAIPTLYDSKPETELAAAAKTLRSEGIELVAGFKGGFSKRDTDILVTSPGVDSRSPLLTEAVKTGIEVIGEIEFAYRIASGPIIAITGTNGKSTTTAMTWHCLQELHENPVLCGNIYGTGYDEIPLTEAAANYPNQPLVAEISSFQLEWIRDFRPKCASITNIAPDHLNRYNSFEDYASAKRRIYECMSEGDTFVHHDDPMTTPPTSAPFKNITTLIDDNKIILQTFEIPIPDLPFSESHNILNAAMAANLAYWHHVGDVKPDESKAARMAAQVTRGLQTFRGLAHRMEFAGEHEGITLINNSMCTNPDALVASSQSVHAKQHLLIGGLTKDLDFGPFANYYKASPHRAYLYGKDADKINARLGGDQPVFRTMGEAFEAATHAAKPGETIMLAPGCASMDQYQDFRARGDEFRTLAKEWLDHVKVSSR